MPQYDESTTQSIDQIKSEKEVKANDNDKSSKSDESDESAQQPITQVKSEKEVKATDNDKSDNSEDVVVTVVTSDGSEVKSEKEVQANDNDKSSKSDESVDPSMGVKILSPKSGKEIPVGNLTIFGVSTDNEKSNCSVSVDWNNEKPFQKAKAAGPYGNEDYSSWAFTYSPSYHTIENGLNDLTSKLECVENSKVTTKWNSVNVTGVITKDANPTSTLVYDDPQGILPQLKPLSTNPSANITGIASNETTIAPTKLSAHLVLPKDQVFPGEPQKFMVKISDPKTLQGVAEAELAIKVVQGSVLLDEYNGTSDESGEYSWNLNSDTLSGKHDVLVSASANGYEPASITGSFDVQKQLLVEASLLKDLVVPGDKQTIEVKVMDANTKEIVSGANVMAKIGQNEYNGTSDTSGAYSHSWDITSDTLSGKSDILVSASANGYEPASITGSFDVQKQLLVEANLLKDLVVPGDKQTIDVKVMDANTKEIVSGANVMAKIGQKNFSASVNDSGVISYSWDTPNTSGGNSYKVALDVSSEGYPKINKTVSFKMDKPQNLLEPPISNYEDKIIKVNNKDLNKNLESQNNKNLESQNNFQGCTNILSSDGCSAEVNDKPVLNPTTDDKPVLNPTTDDKPVLNPTTDDKPILNATTDDKPILDTDNENENIQTEENQNEKIVYDFLASTNK
ncbi:MAG TPA: hypothetical protein VIP29_06635 [Nitrososphaeraceae archaeon]